MQTTETYLTISEASEGIYKEKGSKFLAFAYPVREVNEIKPILDMLKKKYYDAKHICYAYNLGTINKSFRINDDGEPSGTAGKPILGQITSNNLTNILVAVVRYFGGILLGTGGLINAYRSACADAINNAQIVDRYIFEHYSLIFYHENLNQVMKTIKESHIESYEQQFDVKCQMKVKIKKNEKDSVISKLSLINNLKLKFLLVE